MLLKVIEEHFEQYHQLSKNGIFIYQNNYSKEVPNPSGASGASAASSASVIWVSVKEDIGTVEKLTIEQVVELFTSGNLTLNEIFKWLKANSISSRTAITENNIAITFTYQNKSYNICCSKAAAESQTDKITQDTYSFEDLKRVHKLDSDTIDEDFIVVSDCAGLEARYAIRPEYRYKTVQDLKNAVYEQYKNQLILNNFMNGNVSHKSGSKVYETAADLRRTADGKFLSVNNYTQYADQINLSNTKSADKLRREALNKFVVDFCSGNLAYAQVKTILDAIGVQNYRSKTENGNYVITFKYDGKSYTVSCNKEAAKSGLDDITVKLGSLWEFENKLENDGLDYDSKPAILN